MASTIKLKRSTTTGSVPTFSTDLVEGEIALNLKDKILYAANSTAVFELARNTANNGLVLHDGSGNEITITAPPLGSDYSFTLPPDNGTNEQFLQTNGSGTLDWATPVGSGNVNADNSPSDNQLAIWTDGTTIEGNNNVTFDPTGSGTFTLGSSVDLSVGGNATITGDLTVQGTTTTIDVDTVNIEDPLIKLANNNFAGTSDVGLYGRTGSTFTAFYYDNSESEYRLYTGLTVEPSATAVDITNGTFATLQVGTLIGTIDGGTY